MDDYDLSRFTAAAVPVTSGLGIIGGFAKSVDAITARLGMRSYVTEGTDVAGFAEAVGKGADIIMMSDDPMFISYNTLERRYTDNSWGTAMGYAVCLKNAAKGVEGKDVLVVGSGRVGTWATKILIGWGANVTVTDIVHEKAEALTSLGAKAERNVEKAVSDNTLLINAAPYIIPGEIIAQGGDAVRGILPGLITALQQIDALHLRIEALKILDLQVRSPPEGGLSISIVIHAYCIRDERKSQALDSDGYRSLTKYLVQNVEFTGKIHNKCACTADKWK